MAMGCTWQCAATLSPGKLAMCCAAVRLQLQAWQRAACILGQSRQHKLCGFALLTAGCRGCQLVQKVPALLSKPGCSYKTSMVQQCLRAGMHSSHGLCVVVLQVTLNWFSLKLFKHNS